MVRCIKNTFFIITLELGFLGLAFSSQGASYKDMVFVDTNAMATSQSLSLRPFYIEIFETSATEAKALVPSIAYTSPGKPGRMTIDQAKEVCAKKGMRVPTKDEWLAAGSNLGRNTRHTLKGDSLVSTEGKLLANVGSNDSLAIESLSLGIDAIGTLGMTGNRAEYYLNSDGLFGECGGKYETREIVDVGLNRICNTITDNTATVRCVVLDSDINSVVLLSSKTPTELKDYIKIRRGADTGNPNPIFRTKFEDSLISPDPKRDAIPFDQPQDPFEEL